MPYTQGALPQLGILYFIPKELLDLQDQRTGSHDFQTVIEIMESMSKWDNNTGTSEAHITKNVAVENRAFAMLICACVCVLRHLLKELPKDADVMETQRRWSFCLPPLPLEMTLLPLSSKASGLLPIACPLHVGSHNAERGR